MVYTLYLCSTTFYECGSLLTGIPNLMHQRCSQVISCESKLSIKVVLSLLTICCNLKNTGFI